MDRVELLLVLRHEGYPADSYFIDGIHQVQRNEGLGLRQQGGVWELFYRERGLSQVLSRYPTEAEACAGFLNEIRRYIPVAFRRGYHDFAYGWIWESNLRNFLDLLSQYVGYSFDDTDWEAIQGALPDTDDDTADRWYSYPLSGHEYVDVHLARAVGGDEVSIRLNGNVTTALQTRVSVLLDALSASKQYG